MSPADQIAPPTSSRCRHHIQNPDAHLQNNNQNSFLQPELPPTHYTLLKKDMWYNHNNRALVPGQTLFWFPGSGMIKS